jgi:hypothetical protein
MRRRVRNQLVLDLGRDGRTMLPGSAPEELLQALSELLLEALGRQNEGTLTGREVRDASKDHV